MVDAERLSVVRDVDTMGFRSTEAGQTRLVPDGYRPVCLYSLSGDGEVFWYDRRWQPRPPEDMAFKTLNNLGSRRTAIGDFVPDGLLPYASSARHAENLGNILPFGGVMMISGEVAKLLFETGYDNLEVFPVEIELFRKPHRFEKREDRHNGGGDRVAGYWMVNVSRSEDVIDFDTSELEYRLFSDGHRVISGYTRLNFLGELRANNPFYCVGGLSRIFIGKSFLSRLTDSGLRVVAAPKYSLGAWSSFRDASGAYIADEAVLHV